MVGLLETPIEPVGAVTPVVEANGPPKRIKRLERPKRATLDGDLAQVSAEIDKIQKRIHDIKTLIDSKQQNKQAASAEGHDARIRLHELTSSFRSVMDEKRSIRDELDHADKLRERMRADARSLRDKLPYVRVEQIDEQIKKLEYRMTHTSLTLQQEKQMLQQVKELTKSRDFVRDYNDRLEQITQDETSRGYLLEKIREKDAKLNDLKVQQEEQRELLARIKGNDASQSVDIPVLIEERNAAFEKIRGLREEAKQLKGVFWTREEEYWERERQWKEQQAILKRQEYDRRDAERKEREKIRKQRELENFVEPFTDEIIIVDQLSSYLLKYVPAVEEGASSAPQKAEIVAPKGVGNVLVSKKNKFDEETDSWFSGKSKGKKAKAPAPPKNKGKEKLSLSLDALTSFQKVKLSPPTTVGDVAKSVEELKLKKVEYLNLQKESRERRERGEPDVKSKEEATLVATTPAEDVIAADPSAVEAENGEEKADKLVDLTKVDDKEAAVNGDVEGTHPEEHKSKLPEDLERMLPNALDNEIPEFLQAKSPEDLQAKLPEDLKAKLPEDIQPELPLGLEAKLPEDLVGKLPEDLGAKLPEDLEAKLREDLGAKFPEDLETKPIEDSDTKLPDDLETKLPEDLEAKLPKHLEAFLLENVCGKSADTGSELQSDSPEILRA